MGRHASFSKRQSFPDLVKSHHGYDKSDYDTGVRLDHQEVNVSDKSKMIAVIFLASLCESKESAVVCKYCIFVQN